MRLTLVAVALLTASATRAGEVTRHNYKPDVGYVPNAETAIQIAVAVWEPIYGKQQIAGEKPYKATLKDGVWFVEGSLPKGWRGGVAEAEISKDTGTILRVSQGK